MKRTQIKRSNFKRRRRALVHRIKNSRIKVKPETDPSLSPNRVEKDTSGRRLNPVGRRTREWRAVWQWLKPRLEKAGRTRCEFNFIPHVCSDILDPAHSKKRRNMQGDDIYTVAIACRVAHRILDEVMSHAEMETAVLQAVNANGGLILPERKAA